MAARLLPQDWRSILQFSVLSLVILPILPDRGFGPYEAINPHQVWLMIVLISGVSLAGYAALRLVGARYGAPLLGLLPYATLAAVVIVYSVGLIQPAEFRAILQVRTMEFRWAAIACAGVLVLGTLQGIVIAIVVSLIGLSSQAAHPRVYVIGRKRGTDVLRPVSPEHPDDETVDGLLILRPEGRLFFVNAQAVAERIKALVTEHRPKVVVLDMSRVPDIEYSALQMLVEGEQRLAAEHQTTLWLAALNPGVLEVVRRTALAERLGPGGMLFNALTAIQHYRSLPRES